MKQALVILIIMAIFSFIKAEISCSSNLKIVCDKKSIGSCRCAIPNSVGRFVVSHSCDAPLRPRCEGDSTTINCSCVK